MKKILRSLMMATMLFAGVAGASAQDGIDNTFCFVDEAGNVIPDGGTYTSVAQIYELFPGGPQSLEAKFGLGVKNVSDTEAAVALQYRTLDMPNGNLKVCFPDQCLEKTPADYDSNGTVLLSGERKDVATEWLPEKENYGTATFTVQIMLIEGKNILMTDYDILAYGPKVTVKCIYADPAGIDEVYAADGDAVTNVYDMSGRSVLTNATAVEVSALGKGIYICETVKNGKTIATKKIMK